MRSSSNSCRTSACSPWWRRATSRLSRANLCTAPYRSCRHWSGLQSAGALLVMSNSIVLAPGVCGRRPQRAGGIGRHLRRADRHRHHRRLSSCVYRLWMGHRRRRLQLRQHRLRRPAGRQPSFTCAAQGNLKFGILPLAAGIGRRGGEPRAMSGSCCSIPTRRWRSPMQIRPAGLCSWCRSASPCWGLVLHREDQRLALADTAV